LQHAYQILAGVAQHCLAQQAPKRHAHRYFNPAGRGYECLFGAADFALERPLI